MSVLRSRGGVRDVKASYTAAQTDVSLVAAPGAGYSLVVHRIFCQSDVEGKILFEHGSTQVGPVCRVGPGRSALIENLDISLAENTALTVTSDIAGNHEVWVDYTKRRRGDAQTPRAGDGF